LRTLGCFESSEGFFQEEFKERLGIAGLEIKVHGNDVERALKILKRELQKEGLFKEIKQRSFYEKPSVKEKRKQREAQKKRRKALRFKRPVQTAAKK
jgi:small subunit ribosomal protein S21